VHTAYFCDTWKNCFLPVVQSCSLITMGIECKFDVLYIKMMTHKTVAGKIR